MTHAEHVNKPSRNKIVRLTVRHVVLAALAAFWLIPILWLVLNAFSVDKGPNLSHFFPQAFTLDHFRNILLPGGDSVNQFPRWFMNTLIVGCFNCVISSAFVLMVAYAMSCMRFRARKPMMNVAIILNLFPGFLSMIAVYFILKEFGLTNSLTGLVIVYSAGKNRALRQAGHAEVQEYHQGQREAYSSIPDDASSQGAAHQREGKTAPPGETGGRDRGHPPKRLGCENHRSENA